jgi:(1->4)-alpha-D-glucan 1-alpha-D-glucosylmutase
LTAQPIAPASARPLRATYRLQLNSSFGFDDARSLVPYLSDLGISHLYLSPVWQARAGSTHGYDVVDPRRVSVDLGGEEGLRALADAAHDAGMGLVLDTVPNHMATDPANPFWSDPALREQFFDLDPSTGRWRRFFDIDDLAGVRQEDPMVFRTTHELVLSLVADGVADGLRIDHPDGLADPAGYLAALRAGGAERVWVEKILDPGERLRDWPVSGTVGYEFLDDVCALFVDPAGEEPLTALWESVSRDRRGFGEVAHEAKLEQVLGAFAPERDRLHRVCPEVGLDDLSHALAALPVYRTYAEPAAGTVTELDREAVDGLPDSVRRRLLLEQEAPEEFVVRFQQTTPAIMAKGVEDTAFYRYARLLALNDVGGDPSRFSISVDRFHDGCVERLQRFPLNLLTTMTHDTKRSADVRARIGALASVPDDWRACAERWLELTEPLRSDGAPDDVERYFLFQTLVGAWPISSERIGEYMLKALREAKRNTSWVEQDHEWEAGVEQFCQALYADREFISSLEEFVARLAPLGDRAALGQLVLKLTAPGVPDVYQGDELAFRALVDPDNRRPVDWERRRESLARLRGGAAPDADNHKQWLIWKLLSLRARRPEAFSGGYEPVDAGPETVSFVRGGEVLVTVSTRAGGGRLDPPGAGWQDVARDDEHGLAVFERA